MRILTFLRHSSSFFPPSFYLRPKHHPQALYPVCVHPRLPSSSRQPSPPRRRKLPLPARAPPEALPAACSACAGQPLFRGVRSKNFAVHCGNSAGPGALFPSECWVCRPQGSWVPRIRLSGEARLLFTSVFRPRRVRPPTPPACLECALCGSASSRPARSRSRRWASMALRRTCNRCPCRRTWRVSPSGSTSARDRAPRRRRRRARRATRRTGRAPGPVRTRTTRKVGLLSVPQGPPAVTAPGVRGQKLSVVSVPGRDREVRK